MTSLSYEEIFSDFLGNVTDYDFSSMDESTVDYLMSEYLQKTIAVPYIHCLFSSIEADDEIHKLTFEMADTVDDNSDIYFVKNILSKGMIIEWLRPQVRNKVNISQFFGGKEQKWFAQANHLSELRGLLEDTQLEVRKEIRDRGYIYNPYLGES